MDNEQSASTTAKIKSKNGFEWLFTIRKDDSAKELMYKMVAMEKLLLANGYAPLAQNAPFKGNFPPKVTKPCPRHTDALMTEKTSKTTGEKFFSHSRGVYPNLEYCNGTGFAGEGPNDIYGR